MEIMISLAVILVGLMGLFKVMGSSVAGSQSAQRMTQGTARARQVMEAIRTMKPLVLNCLVVNPASQWASCETLCTQKLGAKVAPQACVFSTLSKAGQDKDKVNQQYQVVYDTADNARSSWVRATGTSGRVYDIQVTVGWNDDGTAAPPTRRVTLRSAVLR